LFQLEVNKLKKVFLEIKLAGKKSKKRRGNKLTGTRLRGNIIHISSHSEREKREERGRRGKRLEKKIY